MNHIEIDVIVKEPRVRAKPVGEGRAVKQVQKALRKIKNAIRKQQRRRRA